MGQVTIFPVTFGTAIISPYMEEWAAQDFEALADGPAPTFVYSANAGDVAFGLDSLVEP